MGEQISGNLVFDRSRRLRGVRSSYLNRILMKIYSFGKHCQILYFEKFTFYYSSNFEPFVVFHSDILLFFTILIHKRVKTYFIWMFCGVISRKQYHQNFSLFPVLKHWLSANDKWPKKSVLQCNTGGFLNFDDFE